MPIAPYILIIFSSFAGLLLAIYIFRKKRVKKPLVCPLNANCEAVIYSDFSLFLGVPLEIWGMLYYAAIALGYGFFTVLSDLAIYQTAVFTLIALSTFAFVFSLYLTFIQAFVIHEWCTWCLASAGLTTIIFFTAIFGIGYDLIGILADHFQIILTVNVFALALGLGSATFHGLFYLRFLRDLKISQPEHGTLRVIAQVLWLAIFVLIISGIGILPQIDRVANTNYFAIGMIILAVIILNELITSLAAGPRLIDISFGRRHPHHPGELRRLRQLLFIVASVSLLSWYTLMTVFLLPRELETPLADLIAIYIAVIGVGFVAGFIADQVMAKIDIGT